MEYVPSLQTWSLRWPDNTKSYADEMHTQPDETSVLWQILEDGNSKRQNPDASAEPESSFDPKSSDTEASDLEISGSEGSDLDSEFGPDH